MSPTEPAIATYDASKDYYQLYSCTQGVNGLRGQICGVFGITELQPMTISRDDALALAAAVPDAVAFGAGADAGAGVGAGGGGGVSSFGFSGCGGNGNSIAVVIQT